MSFILKSLLFLCLSGSLSAQEIKMPEAGLSLELPNENWKLAGQQTQNEVTVYYWKREAITNSEGAEVIPNLAVIIETVDQPDIVIYSALKRTEVPFEVSDVFAADDKRINIYNAVGYLGSYEDPEGRPHTVYVVHAVRADKGVQIIMDITSDLFKEYEKEFTSVLKSIKDL